MNDVSQSAPFITLEGGEGAGKTTVLHHILNLLTSMVAPHHTVREPGGTDLSEALRDMVLNRKYAGQNELSEFLMMWAARFSLARQIKEWRSAGKLVVCDRFFDSTYAYQMYGRELNKDLATRDLFFQLRSTLDLEPSLTIYLDIDPVLGLTRASQRQLGLLDNIEQLDLDFHQRVRAGYLEMATSEPGRVRVVDASQPLLQVATKACGIISSHLADKWSSWLMANMD